MHFGLPGAQPVDVEVTFPIAGRRIQTRVPGIDPAGYRGRVLTLRFDAGGQLVR